MKRKKTRRRKQARVTGPFTQKSARPRRGAASIKVTGVGGGGGNVVSRMMSGDKIRGIEFIAINTDAQDLDYTTAHKKLYIGKALTKGLGAGMNPEIGKQAAEENRSEIGEALDDTDVLFLTAGLGGGTGTGGISVIADIAREKGILTIAIVTKPFTFEGAQRTTIAQEGLARLKDKVDALVVIPNDRIFSLISKDTPVMRAFGYIDDVVKNAVQAISELINAPGIINVDFADIKAILKDAGPTLIGIGEASGQDRGMKAVSIAINSPLIELSIDGAKRVLFSVAGGRDLKMTEIHDIAKAVSANLDQNGRVIFGAYHDRAMKEKNIKVTVIASGFNGLFRDRAPLPSLFISGNDQSKGGVKIPIQGIKGNEKDEKNIDEGSDSRTKKKIEPIDKSEAWEIPAFLRKKRK